MWHPLWCEEKHDEEVIQIVGFLHVLPNLQVFRLLVSSSSVASRMEHLV